MNNIVNKSRGALREATSDFLKAAKHAYACLTKERDRLVTNIKRINVRIKRMEEVEAKGKQLAQSSRSAAAKVSQELKAANARLKRGLADAGKEARDMRAEFKIVSKDLRDAGHHLSHALHIDRAVKTIEAKAKAVREKSRSRSAAKRSSQAPGAEVKK